MSIIDGDNPLVGASQVYDLFILQMIIIVLLSRLLAMGLKYLKQPPVIAEVITGIILGPSAMGYVTGWTEFIFPASATNTLNVFANWALILFMFLVGLELDFHLLKRNIRKSIAISLTAIIAPFCLGLLSSLAIYKLEVDNKKVSYGTFLIFVGVALSITAFPVLARILNETKLIGTKVGSLALSCAAVDDVVAWILLAVVVALARAIDAIHALWTFFVLAGFTAFMFFLVKPFLKKVARISHVRQSMQFSVVVFLLLLVFACAFFTDVIGVHAIFGAFITGVITPRENRFALKITERIEDLVVGLLLPLYFTYSGLHTNISALNDGTAWGMVFLIIFTACVGKILGATFASRILGNPWRESFVVGILMNTKGLVELIVLNIGLQYGVLSTKTFTIFVLMALFNTFITTPLVHFLWVKPGKAALDAIVPQKVDRYSVLLCVPDLRAGLGMVNVAHTLQGGYEAFKVKAVYLNEISERPSTYFFDIADKIHAPDLLGRGTRDPLLEALRRHATDLNMEMKTKVLTSHEMSEDMVRFAKKQNFDFVLLGWNDPFVVEEGASAPRASSSGTGPISSLKNSIDIMLDKGVSSLFGPAPPSSQMVEQAVMKIPSSVGVLIDKSAERPLPIKRVIFAYNGYDYERAAVNLLLRMCGAMSIVIINSSPAGSLNIPENRLESSETNSGEEELAILDSPPSITGGDLPHNQKKPKFKVIRASTPNSFQDMKNEIKARVYDLIVIGMEKKSSRSSSSTADPLLQEIIKTSNSSILMVYDRPSNTIPVGSPSSAIV